MYAEYTSLIYRLTVLIITLVITTNAQIPPNEENDKMKQEVEGIGCPFISIKQVLVQNVCLMPDYQSSEAPTNDEGITNVAIALHKPSVLEIDERQNTIKLQLVQYLTWWEPRIRANFSDVPENGVITLSQDNFQEIWHPDLDMFTEDLQQWRSLNHPILFTKGVVVRNDELDQNVTELMALKEWKGTLFCKFEFSSFPLDTQHCAFQQRGSLETMHLLVNPSENLENWKQTVAGFEVTISHVGTFLEYDASGAVGFNITLDRIVNPYLYQYYFPCIAIVVVSQISFIIPLSAIPGRVALVVTQFLTLTNIFIHQMVRHTSTTYIEICSN